MIDYCHQASSWESDEDVALLSDSSKDYTQELETKVPEKL